MLRTPSANSTATGASNRVRKPVNYAELNGNDPTSTYSSQPAVSSVAPVAPIPTEIPAPIRPFPASPVKMVANSAPYAPPNRTSSIHVSPPKPTISVTPKVTIQLPLSKASKREDSESCSSHGSGANTPVASARSSPNKPVAPFFPTSASQMRSSDSLNGAKKRAPLDTSWKELYEDLYEKTSVIEQEQENRIREFKKRCEELEMHVLSLQKELMAIKRKEPKFESVSTNDMVCVREGLHSGDGLDEQVIGIQEVTSKIQQALGMKHIQKQKIVLNGSQPPSRKISVSIDDAKENTPIPSQEMTFNQKDGLPEPIAKETVIDEENTRLISKGASPTQTITLTEGTKLDGGTNVSKEEQVFKPVQIEKELEAMECVTKNGTFESDMLNIMNSLGF